ncbi:cysteine hydrolase family protein [Methanoregula sp.]|jgi:nicotinamidase-related amidase|uniref:cysteine hydrolase family protein n=1 Tax=Methanoregula sp. TaxID=2052170 RepID=UPI003C13174B
MEHPALLIIDMQNDFVREGAQLRVAQSSNILPKIRDVLTCFRKKNLPVFHILRVHRSDGSDVEITRKTLFNRHPFAVAGSLGAQEISELVPIPGEYVIEKARMSAFIGTELDIMLRTLGITELVVTGVQTPNCIRTTAFDAIAFNYPVILVNDATGAQSEEIHRANVRDMENIGIRIMDAQALIRTLG